ncbi:MAG: hypothetical protein NTX61_08815 [Bacteroidetes bacterium]|nr:hypothetical protein [Bacteroidota bacterium]
MKLQGLAVMLLLTILSIDSLSQDIENIVKQKPVSLHGSIGLRLMGYAVDGITARQLPFSYLFTANATVSLYGIEIPFSIVYSDKQKSYAQSFNMAGISPKYKWILLHAGYRNVSFSEYTLAGHTFCGAGVELNPGLFRFGFVYGRFDRATTGNPIFETDSLPRYARRGYAIKLGVGTADNYVDLLFQRIRDDSTTLQKDTSGANRLPEQNVVTGIHARFTLFKKLTCEVEGAFSLYTTDLGAKSVLQENSSPILISLNKYLVVNASSEYYTAIRSSLQYQATNWSLRLEYKRIDPNYRSMGAYFFNNDVENLTINPSFTIFKRKISVNGSIGLQRDNLKRTKQATTLRTIGNVNLSFNPSSKFGINANYSNFNTNQKDGRMLLQENTTINQVNWNFSLMPRLFFMNTKLSHQILLVYNLSKFNDHNKYTAGFTEFSSQVVQANYSLGFLQNNWTFSCGFTYNTSKSSSFDNSGLGGTFGISKSLLKDRLSIDCSNSLSRSESTTGNTWVININLIAAYKIVKHHTIRFITYFTGNYSGSGSSDKSFNEIKGEISYGYNF